MLYLQKNLVVCLFLFYIKAFANSPALLPSTESDPDSFIENCVNVINGDYCESISDIDIQGPDHLILQRYHNTKNYITGDGFGGWRLFNQNYLILGGSLDNQYTEINNEIFEKSQAYVGARSGGILVYSGWLTKNGESKHPLTIDILNDGVGISNTYAKEISGRLNHQNSRLNCAANICEISLGDGSRKLYEIIERLPIIIFGEELNSSLAQRVGQPKFYRLIKETLPSGNHILYSYNIEGHLSSIEMKNSTQAKTFSWIKFTYEIRNDRCLIEALTSDEKSVKYIFTTCCEDGLPHYILSEVSGSHLIPCSYEYQRKNGCFPLVKKILPDGRFVEIEYDQNSKVKRINLPNPVSGKAEVYHSFIYSKNHTDVLNTEGLKTRYHFDNRLQLNSIEKYNSEGVLFRADKKYWGKAPHDMHCLLARTISDGIGNILSYRKFMYDNQQNVKEELLYGNLTGKSNVVLEVDKTGVLQNAEKAECSKSTFEYSKDDFNLLIMAGDNNNNKVAYFYVKGSNLLSKKLVYNNQTICKRIFHTYNEDGVCIQIIEDNGKTENVKDLYGGGITERHITEFKPKVSLPGVGLPEAILKKSINYENRSEVLTEKIAFTYDSQGNPIIADTYDSTDHLAFSERRSYHKLGLVSTEIDRLGHEKIFTYDDCGNTLSLSVPHENKNILYKYDFRNRVLETIETIENHTQVSQNTYDCLGRKIASTDHFGNTTFYQYDEFGGLIQVSHPEVFDEFRNILRPTFNYSYDIFGNVLNSSDPKGNVTSKSYNLRGNPVDIFYPDGTSEHFEYDKEGSLKNTITRNGIKTTYGYDCLGRITREKISVNENDADVYLKARDYKYNAFRCISEEDNCVKKFLYDPAGRVIAITEHARNNIKSQESRKIEFTYDPLGRMSQKKVWFDTAPNDYSIEYITYDLMDNILETKILDHKGELLFLKSFKYDSCGRCIDEYEINHDQKISLLKTTYNAFGEAVQLVDAEGNKTVIEIDNSFINALGQRVLKKTITNPNGLKTDMEFDALARLVSITKIDDHRSLLFSQRIYYDLLGNKCGEVHDQIADGKIIGSKEIRWMYGSTGCLEEEIEAYNTKDEKRTKYSYNLLGQLTKKYYQGCLNPLKYSYDKFGRLNKIEYDDGKNKIGNTYLYDKNGNIITAKTLDGIKVDRSYNPFNQVINEEIDDGLGKYSLKHAYDRTGRVKTITLPDNSSISYSYNALYGREVKRLSPERRQLYTHTYDSYDQQGRLLNETLTGDIGSRFSLYNLNGQKIYSKSDYLEENYAYNTLGHVLNIKTKDNSPQTESIYSYNLLSQITSEDASSFKNYRFDSIDGAIEKDNEPVNQNSLNQLVSHSKMVCEYDCLGNLSKKNQNGLESTFESNILSQLTSVNLPEGKKLNFYYDPFGRRLVKKTSFKNTSKQEISRFFYIGQQEIGSLGQYKKILNLKIPGIKGKRLSLKSLSIEIADKNYTPIHDFSGNIVALIDPSTKQIVESYSYSAFGEECIHNKAHEVLNKSEINNPWRFAEKRIDEETGLVFFGIRYYDPKMQSWISQDPLGFVDGPNLYAYLHNNPLNYIDSFGLSTEDEYFEEDVCDPNNKYCVRNIHGKQSRRQSAGELRRLSTLPKITYCDNIERNPFLEADFWIIEEEYKKHYPSFQCSHIYDLSDEGLLDLPDMEIGFINGVDNSFKQAKISAMHLSRLAGDYNIHAVYGATRGVSKDLRGCFLGLNYIATEPVRLLHRMWNSFFERSSKNAKYLMICHSQGAIHVRNALLDYPPALRERIIVVAIAPGGYIYKESCGQVIHFIAGAHRDPIPRIDQSGMERSKDTIVELESSSKAPIHDHSFSSKTYRRDLIRLISNYFINNGANV